MNGQFQIDSTGIFPKVTLDGKELDGIAEVRVVQRFKEFPQVVILFDASSVSVNGENAVVGVASGEPDIVGFLDSVDPAKLDQAVLSRENFSEGVIVGVLEVLKEWASERD